MESRFTLLMTVRSVYLRFPEVTKGSFELHFKCGNYETKSQRTQITCKANELSKIDTRSNTFRTQILVKESKSTGRGANYMATYKTKPLVLYVMLYTAQNPNLGTKLHEVKYNFDHVINKGKQGVSVPPNIDRQTPCAYKFELTAMPAAQTNDNIHDIAVKEAMKQAGVRDSDAIVPVTGTQLDENFNFFGEHAGAGLRDSDVNKPPPTFNQDK